MWQVFLIMMTVYCKMLDAARTIKLLEFRHQAKDHPVLLASKETQYLKCAFMAIE